MRQTEGSVVCPACGRLVEVQEKNCPFCGHFQPGMFGYSAALRDTLGGVDVTHVIFMVCIGLYIASLALDPRAFTRIGGLMGLLAPGSRALYQLGMTGGYALQENYWYTVFSAVFLHGSLLHLVFNLYWLRRLGSEVEDHLGPVRFTLVYMASGVGGFVISNAMSGAPTIGASGAIFGLLAARWVLGRQHGGSVGNAIAQESLMLAGFLFLLGFLMSHTNNWAHGGGFAAGYLATQAALRGMNKPDSPVLMVLAVLSALGVVVAVVLSFITISATVLGGN